MVQPCCDKVAHVCWKWTMSAGNSISLVYGMQVLFTSVAGPFMCTPTHLALWNDTGLV
jgi:hypothetical protein